MITETVEEWVKRKNQEPVWREVAIAIDNNSMYTKEQESYKTELVNQLGKAFSSDVFSLHWLESPQAVTLFIEKDIVKHATIVILHARKEVTKRVPEKEQLWRALRSLFEETKRLKECNDLAQAEIEELREILDLHLKE